MIIVLHVKTEQTYHEMGNNFLIFRHLPQNNHYQFAGAVPTYTQQCPQELHSMKKCHGDSFKRWPGFHHWLVKGAELCVYFMTRCLLLCYTTLAAAVWLYIKCFLDYLRKTSLSSHPFDNGLAPLCLWLHCQVISLLRHSWEMLFH